MHDAFCNTWPILGHLIGKTAMNGINKYVDLVLYISKDLQVISFTLQNEKTTQTTTDELNHITEGGDVYSYSQRMKPREVKS